MLQSKKCATKPCILHVQMAQPLQAVDLCVLCIPLPNCLLYILDIYNFGCTKVFVVLVLSNKCLVRTKKLINSTEIGFILFTWNLSSKFPDSLKRPIYQEYERFQTSKNFFYSKQLKVVDSSIVNTGKSLSEALIFASINPQL